MKPKLIIIITTILFTLIATIIGLVKSNKRIFSALNFVFGLATIILFLAWTSPTDISWWYWFGGLLASAFLLS